MKIDFSQVIMTLEGVPMKGAQGVEFTLRSACVVALDAITEEAKQVDAKEKYRRGALAARIYRTKEPINLSAEEIVLLKELVGKLFGPRVVHEVWNVLDPSANEEDRIEENKI